MKRNQQTLSQPVTLSGTGLHTGVETTLTLRPAPAGSGRSIHLAGEDGATVIPLTAATTGDHMHRTVAEADGARVHTIEHLLAALAGCGVDNVEIHLTAPEPPGADGSARPLAEAILEAGLEEQNAPAPVATLREPLTVHDGKGAVITALPSDEGLRLTYTVDYPQSRLARGVAECLVTPESFLAELAPARTFCMEAEVEPMRAAGCGQGASYQNTLVLREDEVVENEMRLPDEPARHKLLDLLGDLAVLGRPLCMHIVALRSGHPLNARFAAALQRRLMREENPRGLMDIRQIENTLPHRYPFLLVDRIVEMVPAERVVGIKNVTRNEPFFDGHFPGQPVMPGVLHIEALAQTGLAMMLRESREKGEAKLAVLMSVDDVKYRRPVVPGDQLELTVEMEKWRGRIGQIRGVARVDGETATEARIKFALVDAEDYT